MLITASSHYGGGKIGKPAGQAFAGQGERVREFIEPMQARFGDWHTQGRNVFAAAAEKMNEAADKLRNCVDDTPPAHREDWIDGHPDRRREAHEAHDRDRIH